MNVCSKIQKSLFELQDLKYRDFTAKLTPNISKESIIGVRMPGLRMLAKKYYKYEDIDSFLTDLPHKYFEENNLHANIICEIKDYDILIKCLDDFLPCIDNWATCDILTPKAFKKKRPQLKKEIDRYINSGKTYTVRFGIKMAMSHFLDEDFDERLLYKIAAIKSDEYYINMMIAWYFATALSKQWESAVEFLIQKRLPVFVHNKTIQKALDSYRISNKQKEYLRTFKIKTK